MWSRRFPSLPAAHCRWPWHKDQQGNHLKMIEADLSGYLITWYNVQKARNAQRARKFKAIVTWLFYTFKWKCTFKCEMLLETLTCQITTPTKTKWTKRDCWDICYIPILQKIGVEGSANNDSLEDWIAKVGKGETEWTLDDHFDRTYRWNSTDCQATLLARPFLLASERKVLQMESFKRLYCLCHSRSPAKDVLSYCGMFCSRRNQRSTNTPLKSL